MCNWAVNSDKSTIDCKSYDMIIRLTNIGIQYVLLIIKRIVRAELSARYCQRSVSIDREAFECLRWFTWSYRFVCYVTPIPIVTFYLLAFVFTACKPLAMELKEDYLLVRNRRKEG